MPHKLSPRAREITPAVEHEARRILRVKVLADPCLRTIAENIVGRHWHSYATEAALAIGRRQRAAKRIRKIGKKLKRHRQQPRTGR